MGYEKIEGIVLHTLSYQDKGRIIKIFSKEKGLTSLIIKGLSSKKPLLFSLSTPLSQGYFHIIKNSSQDLFPVKEASLIEDHFFLRQKAEHLSSAIDMVQALLSTQLHHKPSKLLFSLFSSCLKKIPDMKDPSLLSTSFMVKLMIHDGNLHLKELCSSCDQPYLTIYKGECFCQNHSPYSGTRFTDEEKKYLLVLGYCKSFNQLKNLSLPVEVQTKVKKIFKESHH